MACLDYLEIKLIDYCNLNCRACIPFSNIANHGLYDIDEFNKDIRRLAELYDNIKVFRLLGGEPFLLKNLNDYICIIREYFRESQLIVVTNGTLLNNLHEKDIKCFIDNKTEIYVSVYPNKKAPNILHNIEKIKEKQVKISFYKASYFCVNQCYSERILLEDELQKIYERCRKVVDCTNLYKGKLYACPKPFSYQHLNKKFGTAFNFVSDGIDLYLENTNVKSINEYLKHHMEACSLCTMNRGFIKWNDDISNSINDWENTEQNKYIINSKSEESDINEILKSKIMYIEKQAGTYVNYCEDLSVKLLRDIHNAVLIIKNYSISEVELFKIAWLKAEFYINELYYDDDVYESILGKKGKKYVDLFHEETLNYNKYLILNKSIYESYKISYRIMNYLNNRR